MNNIINNASTTKNNDKNDDCGNKNIKTSINSKINENNNKTNVKDSPLKKKLSFKLKLVSDKINNDLNKIISLSERNTSNKFVLGDNVIKDSLTFRNNLMDNKLDAKNIFKTKVIVKFNIPKSKTTYDKLFINKKKPINLLIDKNKIHFKEDAHNKIELKKEKSLDTRNMPQIKGLKINNFEQIYKIKQSLEKIPGSTRDSRDKINKLLFK